jgi:hypothetical protein
VPPGGTFGVNHAAGRGADFDSTAVFTFFSSAFSQYREPLNEEGQMKIAASVVRKHRATVLDRVRQVRAILDAPAPGETPPPGKDWKRTRYDLAMARKVSGEPGKLTYEVIAEETYPLEVFPYWGNANLGATIWTFTVRQDGDGGWWIADFSHPDVRAAYRYGHGCQVTDPTLLPSHSPSRHRAPPRARARGSAIGRCCPAAHGTRSASSTTVPACRRRLTYQQLDDPHN